MLPPDAAAATQGFDGTRTRVNRRSKIQPEANRGGANPWGGFTLDAEHGILFMGTTRGWVQNVTTTTNCMSGIRINPTSSQISVESNVSVRNGASAAGFTCGGI